MRRVGLVLVLGLMVGCGDTGAPAAPGDPIPEPMDESAEEPSPEPEVPNPSVDGVWKAVRYPDCPEDVDPERCSRVISFARVDYMSSTETGEWVSVPGRYLIDHQIWLLDGESLVIDGSIGVTLPWSAGWWDGGIFSIVLVPPGDSELPEAPCEFRVNPDDTIEDANEPEPGIIFCANEAGTAAARIEYDRCSSWGPTSAQSTCPPSQL